MKWLDKLVEKRALELVTQMTGVDRVYHLKVREIEKARTYDGAPKDSVLVKAGGYSEPHVGFWSLNGDLKIDDEVLVAVSRSSG